jgi:hypothetical protein
MMSGRIHSEATLSKKEEPLSSFDPTQGANFTGCMEVANTCPDVGGVEKIPCSSENPVPVIKKYIDIYIYMDCIYPNLDVIIS